MKQSIERDDQLSVKQNKKEELENQSPLFEKKRAQPKELSPTTKSKISDILDQVNAKVDGAEDELGDFDVVDGSEQPMADMIVDSNQNSIAFLDLHIIYEYAYY